MNNLITEFYEKLKYFFLILLIFLFPLNQQLHIRPFPSVEGVIIDYLILKVSIPELFLFLLTIFNLNWIIKFIKEKLPIFLKYWIWLLVVVIFVCFSIYKSRYSVLAAYENLVILLIFLNSFTLPFFQKINMAYLLSISIKVWMVVLLILGSLQFYYQESIFDNYYYTGEFSYTSDNYHIKQDGFLIKNLIPAYGIFSHSNIYGAFFLISCMFLQVLKRNNFYFTIFAILGVLLSGSLNILIGLILFFIFFYLRIDYRFLLIYFVVLFLVSNYMSVNFKQYSDDLSIYRRLYMVDLSNKYFIENPIDAILGFGYYNYFKKVSEDLYFYEIIRFFQPPHNTFYLLIWNYGLLFLICSAFLFFKTFNHMAREYKVLFLVILIISLLDHFIFTNHQLKMLLFFILPYSLNKVFSIKIN